MTLIEGLGLPNTLERMKIGEQALPVLVADAMKQRRLLINNPRDVSEDDALMICKAAF